ncbi:hypothetical protein C2857_004880 [Epichloe festucae Fl1]|uniref:Uncharacterized protein n=1 Tax=Epichloe festucae (strain Fl1) TaxID=877507 RepID=A0A7U3Q0U4_EPIFF|nr:hypothetical protein C2857_004880 [Epichloe festucae Fl1]
MDSSFTREEKRFVLAEILKSSDVGVEHLWRFIEANQIVPNWMNMQVPLGRSLSQCIQIVDHMKDSPSQSKRLSTGSSGEYSRGLQFEHVSGDLVSPRLHQVSPSSTLTPIAILPRPSTDNGQSCVSAARPAHNQNKKRGRPSRADKAKRNLNPKLPPHLAPRPEQGTGHRPILPAAPRQDGESIQPMPQALPQIQSGPSGVERDKKRRRLGDFTQIQQAGPATIKNNTAPAVSSGAI